MKDLQKEIFATIKQFKNIPCIYVTLNKPATKVKEELKKVSLQKDYLYFVDCITSNGKAKNVIFAESPSALTTISISITQLCEKIKGDKLLIIDSLSTFLIYNEINTLASFVSSVTKRNKNKLVVFTPKEKDRTLIDKVCPFFDKIIKL